MKHGGEPHLNGRIGKIRDKTSDGHKERNEPKGRGRCTRLNKDFIRGSRYRRVHGSVSQEENVPENDATPDKEMLYVCEISDGQGHLAVYDPDNTCVHGDTEGFQACDLAVFSERLLLHCSYAEEED